MGSRVLLGERKIVKARMTVMRKRQRGPKDDDDDVPGFVADIWAIEADRGGRFLET